MKVGRPANHDLQLARHLYCAACLRDSNGEYCNWCTTIIRRGESFWQERNELTKQEEGVKGGVAP